MKFRNVFHLKLFHLILRLAEVIIWRFFQKIDVLKSFANLTGKQLSQSFFLKKRLGDRCFPVNFSKFLRSPFLENTSGLLDLDRGKSDPYYGRPAQLKFPRYYFKLLKNNINTNYRVDFLM